MPYWTVGFIALIIYIVINQDVFWGDDEERDAQTRRAYRRFLIGVMVYFAADALWGVLDLMHLVPVLYLDTVVYFATMAISVLLWTQYVVIYLGKEGPFGVFLQHAGRTLFAFQILALLVNFATPIMFSFEPGGVYHAGAARYATLGLQIIMFFLTALYALVIAAKSSGSERRRHWTIGLFSLSMTVLVAVQILLPLLPLYTVGYLFGGCVLHTFVVSDEKEERRRELEEYVRRDQEQKRELASTRLLAYTDALTNVKSKRAYVETTARMDERIAKGKGGAFAVAVFDLNELKVVNDTKGHEEGDRYIIEASQLICNTFKHSPVFRVGGDEFVVLLENRDFNERFELMEAFDQHIDANMREGRLTISSGMADFDPACDTSLHGVFTRADKEMYLRKGVLKNYSANRDATPGSR